ncbi:MAG: NERD domain-containing protein [Tissierellia bacterium]|nr:NERD domain-containing protein [Tissierellia bacterium]
MYENYIALVIVIVWVIGVFAVIINIIFQIIKFLKVKKLKSVASRLRKNISNDNVKSFINLVSKSKIPNKPEVFNALRTTFNLINHSDIIDYNLKKELLNTLLIADVNLGNPRIEKSQRDIEEEKRETGEKGERDVKHNLDFLKLNGYKILHNIRLRNQDFIQEIDHIAIGHNGVFHLETKNHHGTGRITIDKNGNWIKETGGRESSIENPIGQVDRHDMVLKDYLERRFIKRIPVKPLIVIAASGYILEGVENSKIPVVKVDQLTTFIKDHSTSTTLEKQMIDDIHRELSAHT